MTLDSRVDDLRALLLEPRQRAGLVSVHQAALPDHIGGENGGKPALGAFFNHLA
jgi:hypothetical protein